MSWFKNILDADSDTYDWLSIPSTYFDTDVFYQTRYNAVG